METATVLVERAFFERTDGMDKLLREQRDAAEFAGELELAIRTAKVASSQQNWDKVKVLKKSPRAVDAAEYKRTGSARAEQLETNYQVIQENATDPARVLAEARRTLGDVRPPLSPTGAGV